MRRFCAILIVMTFALPALAQDERGWTFSGRFQGSSNSMGLVTKADPTLGYDFSRHFRTYVGVPFYFVKQSASTQTTTTSLTGIGNAYVGLEVGVDTDSVNFTSTVEATAPTGDKSRGFSTGHVTVDWTNTFSRSFSFITPFASMGLANTVSDTSFFVRPFTTDGLVSHFDGGAEFSLSPIADLGASAYAVRASGEQRIISKVFRDPATTPTTPTTRGQGSATRAFETSREILGTAELANDYGFSTWLAARAGSNMDLQVGYTRSAGYDLNTVFFGVGFHFGH